MSIFTKFHIQVIQNIVCILDFDVYNALLSSWILVSIGCCTKGKKIPPFCHLHSGWVKGCGCQRELIGNVEESDGEVISVMMTP